MKAKIKDCLDPRLIGTEVEIDRPMADSEKRRMWDLKYSFNKDAYWCISPNGYGWHLMSNLEVIDE